MAESGHRFFKDEPEFKAAMTEAYRKKYGKEPSANYFGGRNDGMDALTAGASATSSEFGVGYEVMEARSSNPLGRARAQRIGYNRSLQYLAILMRDNTLVGYPGVTEDEWEEYTGFSSTTDYIETVLYRYSNGRWEDKTLSSLPQNNSQSFGQGTTD